MKVLLTMLLSVILLSFTLPAVCQPVIANKKFSLGSTGRVGFGYSPSLEGRTGRSLNLRGQGSIGGRLEQGDYIDLLPALHFTPANAHKDTTDIVFQARLGLYSGGGQFLANVNSRSLDGLTVSLPEAFVEARNIAGTKWSAWAGARYMRHDDIHINDYFYFDDHSSEGFGVSYKNTSLTAVFPAVMDTSGTPPPYTFVNTAAGTPARSLRQRTVLIGEQILPLPGGGSLKLMGEYHRMHKVVKNSDPQYPGDNGWVLGAKHHTPLSTVKKGSFQDLSARIGTGIANGGDNGDTKTWITYGAPDFSTRKFTGAYSVAVVEHFLLNLSKRFSLNGYGLFTKSRGAAGYQTGKDYYGKTTFNKKTDIAAGFRSFVYLSDWFHLLNEVHYTLRRDGDDPYASMLKFTVAPTLVPTGERDPWARPHIRAIFSVAHYNRQARDNAYSAFLQQAGNKSWGTFLGVRCEWWLF
ncbi:carbohydrate porin [Paraflavisolibacter sp. H34]|uniref:carbohydrate porin n=1 Tax=Huijunlia imazamoxiresistens TaxID=3127457 RepID=UPI0030160C17